LVPKGAVTVSTELPAGGRVTVDTLSDGLRGVGGEAASDTVPVNPPDGVTKIVELFDNPPATRVREYLLAVTAIVGPVTVTPISAEWNRKVLPMV
jgi:hypothetical protein